MGALAWAGITHVGKVRSVNEDQFLAEPPVFLVADGMGGHDCGDVASALVTDAFISLVGRDAVETEVVERAVFDANSAVRRAAAHARSERAMGTTLVALVLVGAAGAERWVAVNVGDSRLYRLASGVLEQITTDHSLVQEMVAAGSITASEARTHPERNVVTRAMGISEAIVADFAYLDVREGDRFLLCSDGVHGELADEQLRVLLSRAGGPDEVAQVVCDAVLRGDARDNLTAVVIDVLGDGSSAGGEREVNEDTSPLADDEVADATSEPVASEVEHRPDAVDEVDEVDDPSPAVAIMAVPDGVRVESGRDEPQQPDGDDSGPERVIEVPEW